MSVRSIVTYPDPRLIQRSGEVVEFNDELRSFSQDLAQTMLAKDGFGLAAVQVGELRRVFVLNVRISGVTEIQGKTIPALSPVADNNGPVIFVNPEIVWNSDENVFDKEGCLSFPDIFVPVRRAREVIVAMQTLSGEPVEMYAEGLTARGIQHELDHLDGTLFTEHLSKIKQAAVKKKMIRYHRSDRR